MASEVYGCLSPILAMVALFVLGFVVWGLVSTASQADDVLYGDRQYGGEDDRD